MCASYGLDPRFTESELLDIFEAAVIEGLRAWAEQNAGDVLRPTGIRKRNLNPLITGPSTLEMGWWGYLVDGVPATFASINTRSERLASTAGPLPARAIVPVSYWREMSDRVWHHFAAPNNEVLGLAAVTRPGRTSDGAEYTCYSILMQPATKQLTHVHDRMPLLIGPDFAEEWLCSPLQDGSLIAAAHAASAAISELIQASPAMQKNPDYLF